MPPNSFAQPAFAPLCGLLLALGSTRVHASANSTEVGLWLAVGLLLALQTLLIVGLQRSRLNSKRARLRLREAHRLLEGRIVERTEVLNRTNQQLQAEIAEHEATETLLRETQDYLHSLLNAMPSVLIGVTHQGLVTHWNHAAELQTGIPAEQALGQPLSAVYPELPVAIDNLEAVIAAGIPFTNENIQHNQGGEIRYTDLSIYPLIAVQAIGAVIRIDDVTLRVRMEQTMIQNEKMLSLGELAAGMAHEINNPLSAILHGIQNIQRRTAPEFAANQQTSQALGIDLNQVHAYLQARKVFDMLEDMREAGERSAAIVTNMLEFSRGSSRNHTALDLTTVVRQSLALSQKILALNTPEGSAPPAVIAELTADPVRVSGSAPELQQVLLNLLRNAAQALANRAPDSPAPATIILRLYTQTNGNESREQNANQSANKKADNSSAVIEIEDNGAGMDESVLRHIFEPFFTTKAVGQGTGLGLSVSYFIITEHHAGTIEVESAPGKGSRFIIRLPLYTL